MTQWDEFCALPMDEQDAVVTRVRRLGLYAMFHFAAQLNHFTPDLLEDSVAIILKRQSDITLVESPAHSAASLPAAASASG